MSNIDLSGLITVAEAAARLSVTTDSIRRWIRLGLLPVVRVGPTKKNIRIDPADLERMTSTAPTQ